MSGMLKVETEFAQTLRWIHRNRNQSGMHSSKESAYKLLALGERKSHPLSASQAEPKHCRCVLGGPLRYLFKRIESLALLVDKSESSTQIPFHSCIAELFWNRPLGSH